ncbi:MAG TPA: hypothetical protein VFQ91_08440 [Bryobacteraceae bacterium]|nr:hypothetical protein [Bryobacteraceae bacterium]
MNVDTAALLETINSCFEFSMDGRLTEPARDEFLARGKRLRRQQVELLAAEFEKGNAAVLDANARILAVNVTLQEKQEVLERTADVLTNLAGLAKSLDGLLNIAA